jgi:prepilin-type processing-associated H-X9-DG protein/prepilin-type N-terminal cleavage/methylation domain-containing protein
MRPLLRLPLGHRPFARGFSLVELLAVIAIIGVLVAILLPAIQAARESSRRAQCQNNLRQIGIALAHCVEETGTFPVGCIGCSFSTTDNRRISWNTLLLPYLEQTSLAKQFDMTVAATDPINRIARSVVIDTFLCPSTQEETLLFPIGKWKGSAFTDYGGVYGVEGIGRNIEPPTLTESGETSTPLTFQTLREDSLGVMLYEEGVTPQTVSDGLSKTASTAELAIRRQSQETVWANGHNVVAQEESTPINGTGLGVEIGSPHPGGANLAFCDGHVRFVEESVEQEIFNAMLTKAGGER